MNVAVYFAQILKKFAQIMANFSALGCDCIPMPCYGNERCSPNVKEAPNPKQTKCTSIDKVRKWEDIYLRFGFFLPDDKILNVQQLHSKNARTTESF